MTSNLVFVDASFWISFRDPREFQHRLAREIIEALFRRRAVLVLTLPVLAEIHAYFARSLKLRERILTDLWQNPVVHLEAVSYGDQEKAIDLLRHYRDQEYSLCDAISFVVMQRMTIRRALSFDTHFQHFDEIKVVSDPTNCV